FEPGLVATPFVADGQVLKLTLVNDVLFDVEAWQLDPGASGSLRSGKLQIVAATTGVVEIQGGSTTVNLSAGQFCLIPASLEHTEIGAKLAATLLRVEAH
ncbi:MAG TPA: hypothetical protein VNX46_03485, partial [Candidatus Acidoferrum sp.]|nr:hypothetical protein [Candidatus Acidoferrum sp.]